MKHSTLGIGLLATLLALPTGFAVAAPKEKTATKLDASGAQIVPLDLANSRVVWKGKKVTGAHNGTVALKSGQVELKNGQLTGGNFVIDMTTISNDDLKGETRDKLMGHLKSDDFF